MIGTSPETSPPIVDQRPRCWRCNKELAVFVTRPWHLDCPRCHAPNKRGDLAQAPNGA
jgi:hypothetical protein